MDNKIEKNYDISLKESEEFYNNVVINKRNDDTIDEYVYCFLASKD
jgi:hypothetical protein